MSEQKIEQFWRDATSEDIAKVMRGEKVEARFRDPSAGWGDWVLYAVDNSILFIAGWKDGEWFDHEEDNWTQCQVYEPPQWYIDKPDPGEGWRLLDRDENLEVGDEAKAYGSSHDEWVALSRGFEQGQKDFIWYRRRIERNKPEKLDSSPCIGFPKGWTALSDDEPRLASDAYWSQDAEAWVIITDGWVEAANREKWPAIRLVETHKSLQLKAGYTYRLPSGASIIATKNGFEVF
jgi:hypothetical protein